MNYFAIATVVLRGITMVVPHEFPRPEIVRTSGWPVQRGWHTLATLICGTRRTKMPLSPLKLLRTSMRLRKRGMSLGMRIVARGWMSRTLIGA